MSIEGIKTIRPKSPNSIHVAKLKVQSSNHSSTENNVVSYIVQLCANQFVKIMYYNLVEFMGACMASSYISGHVSRANLHSALHLVQYGAFPSSVKGHMHL